MSQMLPPGDDGKRYEVFEYRVWKAIGLPIVRRWRLFAYLWAFFGCASIFWALKDVTLEEYGEHFRVNWGPYVFAMSILAAVVLGIRIHVCTWSCRRCGHRLGENDPIVQTSDQFTWHACRHCGWLWSYSTGVIHPPTWQYVVANRAKPQEIKVAEKPKDTATEIMTQVRDAMAKDKARQALCPHTRCKIDYAVAGRKLTCHDCGVALDVTHAEACDRQVACEKCGKVKRWGNMCGMRCTPSC